MCFPESRQQWHLSFNFLTPLRMMIRTLWWVPDFLHYLHGVIVDHSSNLPDPGAFSLVEIEYSNGWRIAFCQGVQVSNGRIRERITFTDKILNVLLMTTLGLNLWRLNQSNGKSAAIEGYSSFINIKLFSSIILRVTQKNGNIILEPHVINYILNEFRMITLGSKLI